MTKSAPKARRHAVGADPDRWSAQSKRSGAYDFKREYVNAPYQRWAAGKAELRFDTGFLSAWADALTRWAQFTPYSQNVVKLNMLRKLLAPD